ncbi:hypothetical protein T06_13649 [Trichinella sp. T6]|nr:hypothetical protein T06_13649 [Trichinella sp. T6]
MVTRKKSKKEQPLCPLMEKPWHSKKFRKDIPQFEENAIQKKHTKSLHSYKNHSMVAAAAKEKKSWIPARQPSIHRKLYNCPPLPPPIKSSIPTSHTVLYTEWNTLPPIAPPKQSSILTPLCPLYIQSANPNDPNKIVYPPVTLYSTLYSKTFLQTQCCTSALHSLPHIQNCIPTTNPSTQRVVHPAPPLPPTKQSLNEEKTCMSSQKFKVATMLQMVATMKCNKEQLIRPFMVKLWHTIEQPRFFLVMETENMVEAVG